MNTYELSIPITFESIEKLSIGDVVYLNGIIHTARDEAHAHILDMDEKNEKLPFNLEGAAIYHCGPLIVKENNNWRIVAAGPTTSERMSKMTPQLLEKHNIRALIGKGGMKNIFKNLKNKCVYLAYTGGCAVLAAESIKNVKSVYWPELGMPEAVWELEVDHFGPLIVGIDVHGHDLFEDIRQKSKDEFKKIIHL